MKFKSDIEVQAGLRDGGNDIGTAGQLLSSTGAVTNWIDQGGVVAGEADKAKSVILRVKNSTLSAMTKGQVICENVSISPPNGNLIEVALADNNTAGRMPALGILNEDLDAAGGNNDEGDAIMFGKVSGIDTSSFSVGDEVFVSDVPGGLTITKPTGVKYIQKVGVVIRDDNTNGTIEVFGAGRVNDVPTPLYIDHANQRLGIGAINPTQKLDIRDGELVFTSSSTNQNPSGRIRFNEYGSSLVSGAYIDYDGSSNAFSMFTNDTLNDYEFLRANRNSHLLLQPNGNRVGIGTTSPSEKLVVRNGTSNTDVKILAYNSAAGTEATLKFSTINSETNYEKAAIIARNADGSWGRSDMHFALDSATDTGNVQFSDTKMTILNGGNVGIGTTNPLFKLDLGVNAINLNTATNKQIVLNVNGGYTGQATDQYKVIGYTGSIASNTDIFTQTSGENLKNFYTGVFGGSFFNLSRWGLVQGGSTRFCVLGGTAANGAGNVGINTTSPSEKLEVAGKVYIESQGVAWNTTTPGTTRGALHLDPVGNAAQHTGNAITFGASDTGAGSTAQAGIYTRTDSTYGTRMYLATTESYSAGSRTRMTIYSNGNVGIGALEPAEKLEVAGNIKVSGNQYFNGSSIYGNGDEIIRYSDGWLRINPANNFTNGIYCGSGILRTDGTFQVGPSGSKFVVNSSGNVGIATNGPNHKLEVAGNMLVGNGGSNYLYISDTGNFLYGDSSGNTIIRTVNNFRIQTGISERVRVTYTGYVGIGESAPSSKLYIKGTTSTTSSQLMRIKSSTYLPSSPGRMIEFIRSNDAVRGYISMNQYGVQYNTSSDYRLKENITPINDAVSRLKELKPNRFSWKEGPSDYKVDGFIAHELAKVIPEAVSGEKDAVDENNEPAYQGIDQAKVVPLLTAALQEAISKIEQLETRIQKLENK